MLKCIILFIPGTTWTIAIKFFLIMILFNSIWFNTVRCINNTLFLWYITANIRSFPRFNYFYVTPRTLFCANTNNLWCDSTCNKTKNIGTRKWIFLMPQMTVTIFDVFYFLYKSISIKWINLVIKVSVLSTKYFLSYRYLLFRRSRK